VISIIIPAHNESQVIGSALSGLLPEIEWGAFEVVVVCNGCTDQTASIVRDISDKIICLEVKRPSKTNALNVGDAAAHYFPRVYMDADIKISGLEIKKMCRVLGDNQLLAVSPCMKMALAHASWVVRAYYAVWSSLPYCRAGLIGVGVYALSEEGRQRFGLFPDVVADDGYVRLQFNEHQRSAVAGVDAVVTAPARLSGLLKIKTRSRLGEYQLRAQFPSLFQNDNKQYGHAFRDMLKEHGLADVLAYVMVNIVARLRAKGQMRGEGTMRWERDESSRSL